MSRANVDDFLSRVDEVTAPTCGACASALDDDGPSLDFCDDWCSEQWHATQVEPLTGYREPWYGHDAFPGIGSEAGRWRPPGEFRLPRSTGDLAADRRAARQAYLDAITETQFAAVELRMESLREREQAERKTGPWGNIVLAASQFNDALASPHRYGYIRLHTGPPSPPAPPSIHTAYSRVSFAWPPLGSRLSSDPLTLNGALADPFVAYLDSLAESGPRPCPSCSGSFPNRASGGRIVCENGHSIGFEDLT